MLAEGSTDTDAEIVATLVSNVTTELLLDINVSSYYLMTSEDNFFTQANYGVLTI